MQISTQYYDSTLPNDFYCILFPRYILNTLHEQEESLRAPAAPKPTTQVAKVEPKSPSEDTSSSPGLGLKRWTTEEDLSDSDPAALLNCKRKARSLATFDETPADDKSCPPPAPAPPLTDVYSDSKDSGIHSVGSADIQEDEEDDGQQPESLVQRVFGGKQTTVYKCIDCDFEYKTIDKFLDLQLALPPKTDDNLNVKDLISYLLQPEEMKGDNQYHCRSCNKLKDATRTISIEKPPEHLILTLKRFHYEQSTNQIAKLMIPIECADNITLPTSKSSQEYELYGVVLHTGSTPHSGHYHTQAKSQQNWLWLNDEMVSSIRDRDIGKADTPYVLFYRQCNLEDPAQEPSLDLLLPRLANVIEEDNRSYQQDRSKRFTIQSKSYFGKHDNNQPPPPPPSGGCGENLGQSVNRFVC